MKNKLPNIEPKLDTLLAVIIGYALLDSYNAVEQNAIGNWFMLLGQVLETNSAFIQLNNVYNNQYKQTTSNLNINDLEKIIIIIQKEIEKIKRQL